MKKIVLIIISIIFIFLFCGCNNSDFEDNVSTSEVIINMPKDDKVNGYRMENFNSSIPSTISGDEIDSISSNSDKTEQLCGNKNSKVFHNTDCASVKNMKENNKRYASRSKLISEGYKPCGSCNP